MAVFIICKTVAAFVQTAIIVKKGEQLLITSELSITKQCSFGNQFLTPVNHDSYIWEIIKMFLSEHNKR